MRTTEAAIEEADMVLMLTDARVDSLPEDELFAVFCARRMCPSYWLPIKARARRERGYMRPIAGAGRPDCAVSRARQWHG